MDNFICFGYKILFQLICGWTDLALPGEPQRSRRRTEARGMYHYVHYPRIVWTQRMSKEEEEFLVQNGH